jgi:pimeloyl-ACP methyl ester carboxylesterase
MPTTRLLHVDTNLKDRPRPPGPLLLMLEGRAPLEYFSMLVAFPWLRRLPRGDGHPVMVFPGLGANDATTWPLRGFLRSLGYVTQAWGQGFNAGPRAGVLDRCAADIRALADRTGEPVSLLGWSLGGLYAREMAKEHPEITRCVITLGTPFTGHPRDTNAWRVYEWLTGTRSDGIVAWHCSINPPGPLVENVEVPASHVGMGMNPAALYAIADRLAQPIGEWKPFRASGARRWFFRTDPPASSARSPVR